MNTSQPKLEPADLGQFQDNRCRFPPDQLTAYYGKHVAWSPDGTRILASGDTEDEVEQQLLAAGIPLSQAVAEFIPPPDWVLL